MSLAQIEPVIRKFIADEYNDMLVIKGGWGVGKTYFWQSLIKEASKAKQIGRRSYSYVSLFGIDSIDELKNSILASIVGSKSVDHEDSVKAFLAGAKQWLKGWEDVPVLRQMTGGMANAALFMGLARDTLICFDDIERKGSQLQAQEVLGLASMLKEQRNCKVAFILNEGTMPIEELNSFRKHGEKVIALELEFSPLPAEAFDYAFAVSHPHYELIKSCCLKLRIKNVRILQRIKRLADNLLSYLEGSETVVIEETLRSLILFVWSFYDKDSGAPPLSHVLKFNFVRLVMMKDGDKRTADEKRWDDLLQWYEYRSAEEIDRQIAALVQRGYMDDDIFSVELQTKNSVAKAQQGDRSYAEGWDLYTNSFDDNEDQLVQELPARFRANINYLSVDDLRNTTWLLRELKRDSLAENLIDEFFQAHEGDSNEVKRRRSAFLEDTKDPYLAMRLQESWYPGPSIDKRTLEEVVQEVRRNDGWSHEDIELLAESSVDKYYSFFKSERSDDLYLCIRTCLQFGEFANANDRMKTISDKAREALRRIGSETRLNKVRVDRYL